MRHEDLPLETRQLLSETLALHRQKQSRLPRPGDCFFLKAPTVRPDEELDHALVAALFQEGDALVCSKLSLEYLVASEHDYLMSPETWTGGYTVLVELWNCLSYVPRDPMLIHASISPPTIELLKELFSWHQRGQSPPRGFQGVGKPMPEDPEHPMWAFRAREAGVMERVRRHYHEGWDVKVVRLPIRRIPRAEEVRMAASTDQLASRIERELEAQERDKEVLGPPRLANGRLFLRRDNELPGYKLIWYSEEAASPPEVSTHPPLEGVEAVLPGGVQNILGFWKEENLGKEIVLEVAAEGAPTQVLIRIPRKRK